MRNYKSIAHVALDHKSNVYDDFQKAIGKCIEQNQNNGYQSEIQYSTCATNNIVVYSALILAYTEE